MFLCKRTLGDATDLIVALNLVFELLFIKTHSNCLYISVACRNIRYPAMNVCFYQCCFHCRPYRYHHRGSPSVTEPLPEPHCWASWGQ